MNAHSAPPRLEADRETVRRFLDTLFVHADDSTFISLRAFDDRGRDEKPFIKDAVKVGAPGLLERVCARIAEAANHSTPLVFCPPVATFLTATRARTEDLANGVALSVECDSAPATTLARLTGLLGAPTVAVASGGAWTNPETGEIEPKLHLHWRLTEPTRRAGDHRLLREARQLATTLVGADATGISVVHPFRWPGSWHRKAEPRLAGIVSVTENEIELGQALDQLRASAPAGDQSAKRNPNGPRGKSPFGFETLTADDALDVTAALAVIPNADLPWNEWNRIGMATWAATQGNGFAAFDAWSQRSAKYDAHATRARWEHYAAFPPNDIGAGTLFYLAAQARPGWRKPSSAAACETIERLSADFCVVSDGGKTRVLSFEKHEQEGHSRLVPVFQSFEDFRNFHSNRFVEMADKRVPLGSAWLRHPERRQYSGVIFKPGGEMEIDGRLNLWRGWGVEATLGAWPLMRQHIEEILAAGDADHAEYIIRWIAWLFQNPDRRAEVALAFRGGKGTGKGTLGNALCKILGQHGTHISTAEHLSGRFNGHLRDACLLFADEAYWPGDKGAEGSLKRLITEPDLFIEAKGRDGVTAKNMLHVVMASNEDWLVPAGPDERRYAVFDVCESRRQDASWFGPLNAELDAGGLGAMLYDLMRLDLGDWHPRRAPKTDGLLDQQSRSLRPEDQWWVELLETGMLQGADESRPDRAVSNQYEEKESSAFGGERTAFHKGLYDQAREISPKLKGYSDHALGKVLKAQGCANERVMRRRGWEFPPLAEARAAWEARFPGWAWRIPDLAEWGDG